MPYLYGVGDVGDKPVNPPAGKTADDGHWQLTSSGWSWVDASAAVQHNDVGPSSAAVEMGNTSTADAQTALRDKTYQERENRILQGKADAEIAKNGNPFGNQYQSNLQYTPFGLQPAQQQGGQYGLPSAFGGLSYSSDLLVPQLEQQRMQRIMQAYSPGGGQR